MIPAAPGGSAYTTPPHHRQVHSLSEIPQQPPIPVDGTNRHSNTHSAERTTGGPDGVRGSFHGAKHVPAFEGRKSLPVSGRWQGRTAQTDRGRAGFHRGRPAGHSLPPDRVSDSVLQQFQLRMQISSLTKPCKDIR